MLDTSRASIGKAKLVKHPRTRDHRMKRLLLILILAAQVLGYIVLVEARYEGQGLPAIYFRLTTMSDLISLFFFLNIIGLLLSAIIKPDRIGQVRTVIIAILSAVLLWLDFGVRRTPLDEFDSSAAVALLISMFLLVATLGTRSRAWRSRLASAWRIFQNAIVIAILLVLFAFFYGFFYPTYSNISDISAFNADAGVIFGAAVWSHHHLGERPSPTLRERIDLGYELLTDHAIPRVVVTGASSVPGELPESEIARLEFIKRGIDPGKIIEENQSHSTLEQVQYLRNELYQKQGWQRFVAISDQYHLARICEMCKFNGLMVIGSPSHMHQPFLDLLFYRVRESMALLEYWLLGR